MTRNQIRAALSYAVLAAAIVSCSRGPAPPSPGEDLRPTVVGKIVVARSNTPPFDLEDGSRFSPPVAAEIRRIKNWPVDSVREDGDVSLNSLLLGGSDSNGWWYEVVTDGPNVDGCWSLYGGSFDTGDSIRFSSGLRVAKAPGFSIRPADTHGVQPFPGHADDSVCVDSTGKARYFQLFVGH